MVVVSGGEEKLSLYSLPIFQNSEPCRCFIYSKKQVQSCIKIFLIKKSFKEIASLRKLTFSKDWKKLDIQRSRWKAFQEERTTSAKALRQEHARSTRELQRQPKQSNTNLHFERLTLAAELRSDSMWKKT